MCFPDGIDNVSPPYFAGFQLFDLFGGRYSCLYSLCIRSPSTSLLFPGPNISPETTSGRASDHGQFRSSEVGVVGFNMWGLWGFP